MKTFSPASRVALVLLGLLAPSPCPAAHTKAETHPPAAEPPAAVAEPADAGDLATPKGALRAFDAALPAGGLDAALATYHADNDEERRVARELAEVELATSELQAKTKEKFGPEAADRVLHAARNTTRKDLEEAEAKVDGDHATVTWKTGQPAVPMVKVDGRWRVSVAGVLHALGEEADVERLDATCKAITRDLRRTTKELEAGEYPNANLLERAVRQRMFRVLGDEG